MKGAQINKQDPEGGSGQEKDRYGECKTQITEVSEARTKRCHEGTGAKNYFDGHAPQRGLDTSY